jgi:tetratricopeptide (TPR) repeat protein
MKKITLFTLLISSLFQHLSAQQTKGDTLLTALSSAITDDARQDILMELFDLYENFSVDSNMYYANKVLEIGKQTNNLLIEARAYDEIGYVYWRIDNRRKCLEKTLQSLRMAEKIGNQRLIGYIYVGLASVQEPGKAIAYLKTAIRYLENTNGYKELCIALNDISINYLNIHKPDSALIYTQWAYKLIQQHNYKPYLSYTLGSLGAIQLELGNTGLALEYYKLAINDAIEKNSDPLLYNAYNQVALFYRKQGNNDSAFHYSQKSYSLAQKGPARWMIIPSGIFYEMYKKQGKSDSALKYHEIYKEAQDSLFSTQKVQWVQATSIEEDLRQKEILVEKEKTIKERKHNIQYAALAIGIITLLILFLLLSRSIIVNEQLVKFFGIIGLLIVFEFINLVLHPYLANLTHDSPILMLLILVCIAVILVPAHHRLEKWLTSRLVEKNKRIWLAAAKRTIEVLERKPTIQ